MDGLLISAAGLIAAAAITPGPNNLVVMRVAADSGFIRAIPAIVGILTGGLIMLALVMAGAGIVFAAVPQLQLVIATGGGVYLCWLGATLVGGSFARAAAPDQQPDTRALPLGAAAMFGFQFLNPKSWIMVLTVTAAVSGDAGASQTFFPLAALFTLIPALCLVLWSALGTLMTRHLRHPPVRRWVDRAMGSLLFLSALPLFLAPGDAAFP